MDIGNSFAVESLGTTTEREQVMSHNQNVLAKMLAIFAVRKAQTGVQLSPHLKLMSALEEAICDARARRDAISAEGGAGSVQYLHLNDQVARWEAASRQNR